MKGVVYNIDFKNPYGQIENYEKLNMNQMIGLVKNLIKDKYDIDIKVSKHIIYNLIHRNNVNPFLKKICKIEKC